MACCGQGKARPMTTNATAVQLNPPEGYAEVVFVRGGAIAPRGLATNERYRRVGQGDRFWVHPDDLTAEQHRVGGPWFQAHQASIVEEDIDLNAITDPTEEGSWIAVLTASQQEALVNAGFDSVEDINTATDAELLAIDGIGKATVQNLRDALA